MSKKRRSHGVKRVLQVLTPGQREIITRMYLIWLVRFGDVLPDVATCADCSEFKRAVCPGDDLKGRETYECVGIQSFIELSGPSVHRSSQSVESRFGFNGIDQ